MTACYKVLDQQVFTSGEYSIVPLRMQDRYAIMKWRNEQIYHLRQDKPLTKEDQDKYFDTVIANLFEQEKPNQILFSYLKNHQCLGYGGLVHINWVDKNAEISFVMDTHLEKKYFELNWKIFLELIQKVAFKNLDVHKVFTYAFDLRPHLYEVLEKSGFQKEAVLKEHCYFNDKFLNVVIHSRIADYKRLTYREATVSDAELFFNWANDNEVRKNSISSNVIKWEEHIKWFKNKIEDTKSHLFLFFEDGKPIGQVRLDFESNSWLIDFSVDTSFRGMGYGSKMLRKIIDKREYGKFKAYVKKTNIGSVKVFKKLNFIETGNKQTENFELTEFTLN
jgi:RimJ/RimL family protein N-acetyltransferase